jgi:hypothetical protein
MSKIEDYSLDERKEIIEIQEFMCRRCLGVHTKCKDNGCLGLQDDLFKKIISKRGNMQRFPSKRDKL